MMIEELVPAKAFAPIDGGVERENVITVIFEQPENALLSMLVTLLGMEIEPAIDEQPENAEFLIVFNELPLIVKPVIFAHPEKAWLPIEVTEVGIVTVDAIDEQFLKTPSAMADMLLLMVKDVNPEQPENA